MTIVLNTEQVESIQQAEAKVQLRCPMRMNGSCWDVNQKLGWSAGFPAADCDACPGPGGVGEKYREGIVQRELEAVVHGVRNTPAPYSRGVIVALTYKHKVIGSEEWNEPHVQNRVKGPVRWVVVKKTWEKALAFAKALGSRITGHVPVEMLERRWACCTGMLLSGKRVAPVCQMLQKGKDHFYCGACGCGDHDLARIGPCIPEGSPVDPAALTKLRFPALECPLEKSGFSNSAPNTL